MLIDGGPAERAIVPALVAAAMTSATFVLLGTAPSASVVIAALAGTFIIYVLDRALWVGLEDAHARARWRLAETIGVCISAFALGTTIPTLRIETLVIGGIIGAAALLYSIPVRGRRLKSFGSAKPMLVIAGWVLGSVLVPAAESGLGSSQELIMLAIYRFFYLLPCVMLADLADAAHDRAAGITTPSNRMPRAFVMRVCELAIGAAALTAGVACLAGFGGLILVDAVGLIVAWSVMRSSHGANTRSFYLDLAMTWPAVTTMTWIVLA
jgi:hypothetical protein